MLLKWRRRFRLLGVRGGWALAGAHDLFQLLLIKSLQLGRLAAGVFAVDLDHRSDEELLLLVRLRLPVVGLPDGDQKARVTGPFFPVPWYIGPGKGFDAS